MRREAERTKHIDWGVDVVVVQGAVEVDVAFRDVTAKALIYKANRRWATREREITPSNREWGA
jgi:hypothetical protein